MLTSDKIPVDDSRPEPTDEFARVFCAERCRLWQLVRFRLDQTLQRRVDVDDVMQEVYLQGSDRFEIYLASDYPTPFLWLRDVAIQTLHNVHRFHMGTQQRSIHRETHPGAAVVSNPDPVQRLAAAITTPSQVAIRGEVIQAIQNALDKLSPRDREVIQLRQFEELANAEVAHVLGISHKAASIRYVRAVGRLRILVEQASGEFIPH